MVRLQLENSKASHLVVETEREGKRTSRKTTCSWNQEIVSKIAHFEYVKNDTQITAHYQFIRITILVILSNRFLNFNSMKSSCPQSVAAFFKNFIFILWNLFLTTFVFCSKSYFKNYAVRRGQKLKICLASSLLYILGIRERCI